MKTVMKATQVYIGAKPDYVAPELWTKDSVGQPIEIDFDRIGKLQPDHMDDGTPMFDIDYFDVAEGIEKSICILADFKLEQR